MQPFSPPTRELVIDRQRYLAMFEVLGQEHWPWFAVTASDQIHVDSHRNELVVALNAANAIAPVVSAVCGNSPIAAGRRAPHGGIAGRDAALLGLARYGLPEHLGFEAQVRGCPKSTVLGPLVHSPTKRPAALSS